MKKYIVKGMEKLSASLDLEFSYTVANHNFELGLPLENALKGFFRDYFPDRYSFGSGYLVDFDENISNQCDWIIYDSYHFAPLIAKSSSIDNVEFYPFDSCFASVEVKRTLNEDVIKKAITQIARSKCLKRTSSSPGFVNPFLNISKGLNFDQDGLNKIWVNHFHCGIYAYSQSEFDDPKNLIDLLVNNGNFELLPDFIAVHGQYYLTKVHMYNTPTKENCVRLTHLPQQYNAFAVIPTKSNTSAFFYTRLLNILSNTFLSAKDYRDSLEQISTEVTFQDQTIFTGLKPTIYSKEID